MTFYIIKNLYAKLFFEGFVETYFILNCAKITKANVREKNSKLVIIILLIANMFILHV